MADYTVDIGGGSTMMIRDTGSIVEFWFKTGSSTWNNEQPWGYFANGVSSGTLEYRLLRGGNWQKFGQVTVTQDQSVTFSIFNSGVGFPTYNFTQHITRSTVPPAPNLRTATAISTSEVHVIFFSMGNGGSPILQWQIGYGPSSAGPTYTVTSDGDSIVSPFLNGQRSYFWARGRNALGWGPWSNRREATTWRGPDTPSAPIIVNVTQVSAGVRFTDRGHGGTPIIERQIGYGKSPSNPTDFVSAPLGPDGITGLDPGKTYYFWARSRNAVGWSNWSARTTANLIAGARVLVGNTWFRAVPYVRVEGQWKVAQPWVKSQGIWKTPKV